MNRLHLGQRKCLENPPTVSWVQFQLSHKTMMQTTPINTALSNETDQGSPTKFNHKTKISLISWCNFRNKCSQKLINLAPNPTELSGILTIILRDPSWKTQEGSERIHQVKPSSRIRKIQIVCLAFIQAIVAIFRICQFCHHSRSLTSWMVLLRKFKLLRRLSGS